jgi:hypothetical protein
MSFAKLIHSMGLVCVFAGSLIALALANNLTFGLGIAWMEYALWSENQRVRQIA